MKTVTYNDILYKAAELAGRTRDKLLTIEATMLKGYIAADLIELWNSQAWPDLNPVPLAVTVSSRQFSRNEGAANEMGDILCVLSANPLTTSRLRNIGFSEIDGSVVIEEDLAQVYVDYILPAPDLMIDVAEDDLPAYEIPRRFANILACRAAEKLLRADGDLNGAGVQHGMAESALNTELTRLPPQPWWRGVTVRKEFAGGVSTTPTVV